MARFTAGQIIDGRVWLQIKPLTREHDFTVNTDKPPKPRKVTPLSVAPEDEDWISSCL